MILTTFGDSHQLCIKNIPRVQIKRGINDPITMSRFGLEKTNLINIKNYNVQEGEAVLFSFGEIDCRCHLCKSESIDICKNLIDQIVPRYFYAINDNVKQYSKLITLVFNVVPTMRKGHPKAIKDNPAFPLIGTNEQRRITTLYMNQKLKEYCDEYNYIFVDIYDKYCDNDGLLKFELSDKNVHINNEIFIVEFFKNNLELWLKDK